MRPWRSASAKALLGFGLILVGLVGLVVLATPAGAHNALEQVDPPDGTMLSDGASITFRFSADVPLETMSVEVIDAASTRTAVVGLRQGVSAREVVAPLTPGLSGAITVRWRLVGPDGHVLTDRIRYVVQDDGPTSPTVTQERVASPDEVAPSEYRPTSELTRWLLRAGSYLAMVVAFGVVVTRRLVWPGLSTIVAVDVVLGASLLVVAGLAVAQLLIIAGDISQRSAWSALGETTLALQTDAGPALLVRFGVAVLMALLVAWARMGRSRRPIEVPLLALGVVLLATWSFAGHARSLRWAAIGVPLDVVHHAAAATWLGGLASVGLIGLRLLEPPEAARIVERFGRVAAWAVAVLGLSGLIGAARFAVGANALLDPHTRLLAAKLTVLAAMLWVANVNRKRVARWAATGRTPRRGHLWALRRAMATELLIGVGVLAITAMLVVTTPTTS